LGRPRVLYLLRDYPQLSQTYIQTEMDALQERFRIGVITRRRADLPTRRHLSHRRCRREWSAKLFARLFRPQVAHVHWLTEVVWAAKLGVPYTVRAHSFDLLTADGAHVRAAAPLLRDDLCLGVLTLPFGRPILEAAGIPEEKIEVTGPVLHFERFFDPGPNGDGVLNVGACLPKKRMEDFVDLAAAVPECTFRLYAIGYETEAIRAYNAGRNDPVEMVPALEPEQMPAAYKQHRWMVYTARKDPPGCGWPVAVVEAQAAGTGVCLPRHLPMAREYVGDTAVLYDSVEELRDLVTAPVPDPMRRAAFENARRFDIRSQVQTLLDLWRPVLHPNVRAGLGTSDQRRRWWCR